jgi:TolA-binding protein
MKTLPRLALAVMTLVGSLSLADTRPSDGRPTDAVESTEARKAPAEADHARVGPMQSELEQRVQALEAELARVREQEQDRYQFPGAWNVGTDGP